MIKNGMLDKIDSTTFQFTGNGSGNATKTALFFCPEDAVSMSGVKSFNETETRFIMGFLGSAILCSSIAKPGFDGSDVERFSRFINACGFLSALPLSRLNVFSLAT